MPALDITQDRQFLCHIFEAVAYRLVRPKNVSSAAHVHNYILRCIYISQLWAQSMGYDHTIPYRCYHSHHSHQWPSYQASNWSTALGKTFGQITHLFCKSRFAEVFYKQNLNEITSLKLLQQLKPVVIQINSLLSKTIIDVHCTALHCCLCCRTCAPMQIQICSIGSDCLNS